MKKLIIIITMGMQLQGSSQVMQIYSESFSNGVPASWTMTPSGSWTIHPTFGTQNGSCIISEEPGSNSVAVSVQSGSINLSGVVSPTVTFKMAITKNNFVCANVVLNYVDGTGDHFVARWGTGFSPNTTYTFTDDGFDPSPPLDPQNIYWFTMTQKIITNSPWMKLKFDAEFINGGYVLLDSISVSAQNSDPNGISETVGTELICQNPFERKKGVVQAERLKSIEVYDQLGKIQLIKVDSISDNRFLIDLSAISEGCYYLQCFMDDGSIVRRKIIMD
jgi:hypothetical protein